MIFRRLFWRLFLVVTFLILPPLGVFCEVARNSWGLSGLQSCLLLVVLLSLGIMAVLGPGLLHQAYHYLRGRRSREAGISCVQCRRTAFPLEGTTLRYRCWSCGCRFDGPEHF
jgi:hypothetical protein